MRSKPILRRDCSIAGCIWKRAVPVRLRSGLSLFEVIVALAIFVGSIAAIGQLISTGVRGAVQARLQSQAVLRAETIMGEAVAGLVSVHGQTGVFPDDQSWHWSVTTTASAHEGLYLVEVVVTHAAGTSIGRQSYSVRRLVRDPQIALDAYKKQQEEAAANASNSSGSSTGSTGGSSAGSSSGGSK
jgi:hypothetical protein